MDITGLTLLRSDELHQRRRECMADRDRERVGGMVRRRHLVEREDRLHHLPDLLLVRPAVAAHGLLHGRRGVLSARDADGRCGDEHGPPGLSDGECDAGVCADVRLLQGDGIRGVLGDQLLDAREDREQTSLRTLSGRRSPPPVARGPEAPSASLDDSVPACSRPRVDTKNLHHDTLGVPPDVPAVSTERQREGPQAAVAGGPQRKHDGCAGKNANRRAGEHVGRVMHADVDP
jgi:hypothetical protein